MGAAPLLSTIQVRKAIAERAAGFNLAAIAKRLCINPNTLARRMKLLLEDDEWAARKNKQPEAIADSGLRQLTPFELMTGRKSKSQEQAQPVPRPTPPPS